MNAILTSTWMNQLNPHYTFKVRNNGNRAVDKIKFRISFLDENGQEIGSTEKQVFYSPGIAANGGVWEPPTDNLEEVKNIPDTWKEGALKFEVLDVKFKK